MRKLFHSVVCLSLYAGMALANPSSGGGTTAKFKDEKEKKSYVIGFQVGKDFAQQIKASLGSDINFTILAQGFKDAVEGKDSAIKSEEFQKLMQALEQDVRNKYEEQQKAVQEQARKNLEEGKKWLAENKKKQGVKVTNSGLQYKVIKEGNGPKPKATDTVKVHYKGTLINGQEFDSSYKRNEPAVFPLNQVIKGWTEGVQLMPVGSKYEFYITPELAYGENAPPNIGPNQVLIFEVELLEIVNTNQPKK